MTQGIDTTLIGKPIKKLTPDELSALASQLSTLTSEVETRQKAIKEQVEKEQLNKIVAVAKEVAQTLGWAKLPKLTLVPDGANYTISYAAEKVKGVKGIGKRATPDVSGGKVTIYKIGVTKGGIDHFRDKDGNKHEGIKDLVKALRNPDTGEPEANRCWDISRKGISASDIVTKYHADEVILVYQSGGEQLVKDAVEEVKSARG